MVLLDKPISLTPLQTIEKFKEQNPKYKDKKMSYAGRLDPMARGLLVILVGEENKNREKYENMDKEYEFEILFGVGTDTYDVMGLLESLNIADYSEDLERQVEDHLVDFRGKVKQEYPPYSSYSIEGKPLFWWARKDKLDEINIPTKEVEVKKLDNLSSYKLEVGQVLENVKQRVSAAKGDFRQEEIIEKWEDLAEQNPEFSFQIFKFKATVTSGTYIRSIAHNLGQKVSTGAIAFDILRTSLGEYDLKDAESI